jgi:hypothetical protein
MGNTCCRCGNIKFHSWVVFKQHMQELHGQHVIQSNAFRPYIPMDPVQKQTEVERGETTIRDRAWFKGQTNPLLGSDKVNVEPSWDGNMRTV